MTSAHIRENVLLAPLTTFHIGGSARYFAEVTTANQLPELFAFASEQRIPVFVLGGGSNVLVDDRGYHGLVIKMNIRDLHVAGAGDTTGAQFVTAGAGMLWDEYVKYVVEKMFWGAENLSSIPGTVGGAVVQNIGAYGCEVKEIVEWVEVYDVMEKSIRTLSNPACEFGYRDSMFKHDGARYVVTRVQLRLQKNGTPNIFYKDLAAYFLKEGMVTPTIQDVRSAVVLIRSAKFPVLETRGTAGSFFKNPVVTRVVGETFLERYPNAVHYDIGGGLMKLSAAWIIDNILHMRGVRDGNVGCWSEQALVIVNYGGASSAEVKNFVQNIQKKFLNETKIALEREVIFVDT